jgi:hypothetical protein
MVPGLQPRSPRKVDLGTPHLPVAMTCVAEHNDGVTDVTDGYWQGELDSVLRKGVVCKTEAAMAETTMPAQPRQIVSVVLPRSARGSNGSGYGSWRNRLDPRFLEFSRDDHGGAQGHGAIAGDLPPHSIGFE